MRSTHRLSDLQRFSFRNADISRSLMIKVLGIPALQQPDYCMLILKHNVQVTLSQLAQESTFSSITAEKH